MVEFFAKIFDTKPQHPIRICAPGATRDAGNLVAMYKTETVIAQNKQGVLQGRSDAICIRHGNS